MADFLVQRVVLPPEPRLARLYYRAANPRPYRHLDPRSQGRRSLILDGGTGVSFKSYFNCFFEPHWRRHTSLGMLKLRLALSGTGRVRVWRWSALAGEHLLHSVDVSGGERELLLDVPAPRIHPCERGAIYFDLLGRGDGITLHAGDWLAVDATPREVGLVAGYCTFNREPHLLANLRALLGDAEAADRLTRVVVVDQGDSRVRAHPDWASLPPGRDAKVRLVEQDNYGGSGGFTRAVLEAQGVPGASHVLLLDDDATVEPECVLRAASFLALARGDVAVGGQMLDGIRLTHVHDFTYRLDPGTLGVRPVIGTVDLGKDEQLGCLRGLHSNPFGAWWFFAFPLSAVGRAGLPLPFFIHFDDAEFGLRLAAAGIQNVPLPGLGVWHDPAYIKARGWTPYYDYRNILATFALHGRLPGRFLFRVLVKELLRALLKMDYFRAWALGEALRDYRRGPESLGRPRKTHQGVLEAWCRLKGGSLSRAGGPPVVTPPRPPAGRWRAALGLTRSLWHQLARRSPPPDLTPGVTVLLVHEHTWALGRLDAVAVDDAYREDLVVLRRSRPLFTRLLARGLGEAVRVAWSAARVARRWREGLARLGSRDAWLRYLGLPPDAAATPAEPGPRRRCA